ncbi:MAG: hypothetical protein HRU40_20045, partial [Saprospiraceae bacterium]|nr:hypothetical protein [Saprospiraceae bacterium]
ELCFVVPGNANFTKGAIRARFRLNCEADPSAVTPMNLLIGGEVEDYYLPVAKLGNYTWMDNDLRGDQMFTDSPNMGLHANETGVNEVAFVLTWFGEDGILATDDDRVYIKVSASGTQGEGEDGIYYFCGIQQGNYRVTPLKYATNENVGADIITDEAGITYDVTKSDTIIISGSGQPRYALAPERKILTVPNLLGDDDEDSDGVPYFDLSIPELTTSGLVINEDGNGDVPMPFAHPDSLTELRIDFGWIQDPNLEVIQKIVGVDYPESGVCGHFNVIVDACILNTAGSAMGYQMGVPLEHIQMGIDFTEAFGDAFISMVGNPLLIGANIDSEGHNPDLMVTGYDDLSGYFTVPDAPRLYPVVNQSFDGNLDTLVFVPGTGLLWPGEKIMVRYTLEVAPENINEIDALNLNWNSKVSGLATNYQGVHIPDYFLNGMQLMAMDLSNDSFQADGSYTDPDQATNLGDCWQKAAQFSAFDQVNLIADEACNVTVEPELLLQPHFDECDFDTFPLGGYYRFGTEGMNGKFFRPTDLDASQFVNGTIKFFIETVNKSCETRWGLLLLEDKKAPVLDSTNFTTDTFFCTDLSVIKDNPVTIDPNSDLFTGTASFTDGCGTRLASFSFDDDVEFGDCGDDFFAKIYRTFIAQGPEGERSTVTQELVFIRPDLDDLHFAPSEVEQQSCSVEPIDINVWPFWINPFGDTLYLNDADCNYGVKVDDVSFPICDAKGAKIVRTIHVYDWCLDQHIPVDTVLIKMGDFSNPLFTGKAENALTDMPLVNPMVMHGVHPSSDNTTMLSTGPTDCTAGFSVGLNALKDRFGFDIEDCEIVDYSIAIWGYGPEYAYGIATGDTIWREENFPVINNVTAGIPVGEYAIVIEAFDGCYNAAKGVTYFVVEDGVAPVMKCDDDLNITLSTDSYAKVYATDIDEGSWDNCALASLEVRREDDSLDGYSAWGDYVEFDCADLGAPVIVELRGTDASGNTNICWMDLTIEDKVAPVCADLDNELTYCDAPQLVDLTRFGAPDVPFSNCSNIVIEELAAIDGRDNCGFGTITRQYQAVKNA